MRKINLLRGWALLPFVLILIIVLTGCAENKIHLGTIQAPPQTNKLRVVVLTISEPFLTDVFGRKRPHEMSYEEFTKNQYKITTRFLIMKGIYDVVPEGDVKAVLGTQQPTEQQLQENNWMLARQIAGALYANYILLVERGTEAPLSFYWNIKMINVETGKVFSVKEKMFGRGTQDDIIRTVNAAYRNLFKEAKSDLLATAVRKGRVTPASPPTSTPPRLLPQPHVKPEPAPAKPLPDRIVEPKIVQRPASKEKDKTKLVVYDFNTAENLNVVALILTEALREELYTLGHFQLVNRENLNQIMQELQLQQSGLVDDNQVVKIGNWLGASESVTGRLAVLGNTYVLSAKRTDINTLGTLGIGSLKCKQGQEEELLNGMPELARTLIKSSKK